MKRIVVISLAVILCFIRCTDNNKISTKNITSAEIIFGLEFTDSERDSMLQDLEDNLSAYDVIRKTYLRNSVAPSVNFNPIPVGFNFNRTKNEFILSPSANPVVPENYEELAFYSVKDLSELIKSRKITSVELTKMFIQRIKKFDPQLKCVVTLTEELAFKQAQKADEEIANGKYKGPLHGIPYGVKDLLAVEGYKTTWGAEPYKDQVINETATVVKKLEEAGAVLIAKLTLGALAWGDVWFGGTTKNPWNLDEGSSGSSAGPGSATAAGLVAFSIGSETWGSIVSPSTRCGATGLRPTYGRVSRTGAMALSWTMDKLGPICRSVEDCAIVFNSIYGPDGIDQMLFDAPFDYNYKVDLAKLKIGYVKSLFEEDYPGKEYDLSALEKFREMGAELIPVELPDLPVDAISFILSAEAAAAFDDLTRSGKDDLMVRQIRNAWPNVFRASRFIPAVEYIQANRIRYMVIQEMKNIFDEVDIYIAPSFGGNNLLLTNLTGHPCVVLPNGFTEKNTPVSISFIGNLFDEGKLLAVTKMYQDATEFNKKYPPEFK